MNRRYLATLAVAATVVLGVGMFLRDRLLHDDTPAPAAPPSEASALQQLSQAGQLRRMSGYLAERVSTLATFVEYVPATGTAGVRWAGDTVLTTRPDRPVVAVRAPSTDSLRRTVAVGPDSLRRDWVLVVGRRAAGQVVSAAGFAGGRAAARCADRSVEEYLLGVPLHEGFAGAGLFNLEGQLLGIVVRCDGRLIALPARQAARLLAEDDAGTPAARDPFGLSVEPLAGPARAYFGADSGLLVTAVRRGGPADLAGLRAGDVIVAVDGRPVAAGATAGLFQAGAPADSHTVSRRRGRAVATVRLAPRAAAATSATPSTAGALGIDVAPALPARGVEITAVRAGSAAAAAGLLPGDRLLRVGDTPVTSPAAAARLLAAPNAAPTFVVFDRDSVERGVLLPR